MARPLRIEFPGAVYHVTSRGDRREPIFEDDADRQAFVGVVALAHVAGGHAMSVIAKEAGLSVSRVSRIVRAWETEKAKGKASPFPALKSVP